MFFDKHLLIKWLVLDARHRDVLQVCELVAQIWKVNFHIEKPDSNVAQIYQKFISSLAYNMHSYNGEGESYAIVTLEILDYRKTYTHLAESNLVYQNLYWKNSYQFFNLLILRRLNFHVAFFECILPSLQAS